ncbi:MAG: hypothetical protein ACI92B_000939 [Marinobacter maritimus]|jgi:hypothetical protein
MILGRIKMILFAIAGSAFLGLCGLVYWLYQDNQQLSGETQRLQQTNDALAESARNQKEVADSLTADIKVRDDLAIRALQAREEADQRLNRVRQQLHDALEADRCAREPHPAAVGDWLRKNSDGL